MAAPVLERPASRPPVREAHMEPVRIENGKVIFEPRAMEIGRYYWVELGGKPYGYRKVSPVEVEIYGLAD